MPMTVVVTRDVAARFRGFLASCMLEIAPGVYTAPAMSAGVRDRVWRVLQEWYGELGGGAMIMTWRDTGHPAGQQILTLGTPPVDMIDHDGVYLSRRPLTATELGKKSPSASKKADALPPEQANATDQQAGRLDLLGTE